MIKATLKVQGRTVLYLGLSFGSLDRFREQPMDTFIEIKGAELGLPIDVVLFSGVTDEAMADHLLQEGVIGPGTKVTVSTRKRN